MDNKKIIVILLLITIILSIASVIITLDLNISELPEPSVGGTNAGNVQLVIEKNPELGGNE